MARLNVLFVVLLVASALAAVSMQHQSRKLVAAIEREQNRARALDVEWGQLQIESGTWAAHARVEKIAREKLAMVTPQHQALVTLDSMPQQDAAQGGTGR
ncbi:MAG: cell division protein FtsL [Moraxellaceae bacterium]|nr:cell division protein FtsL [Moraxellaceae bacterium]